MPGTAPTQTKGFWSDGRAAEINKLMSAEASAEHVPVKPSGGVCGAIGVRTDDGCRPKHQETVETQDLSSVFPDFDSDTLQAIIRKELESLNQIVKEEEELDKSHIGRQEPGPTAYEGRITMRKVESDDCIREAVDIIASKNGMSDEQRNAALARLGLFSERQSQALSTLCYGEEHGDILSTADLTIRVRAAMDSGAVDHVINPEDLPANVEPSGAVGDEHYVGANNSKIKRYGEAVTNCAHAGGSFGMRWNCAAVSRPLNSVSKIAGPMGPVGKQDVLFDNNSCYVVQPGVVKAIMKVIKAVAEYPREGNLYLADLALTSFVGQGLDQ